jgi:hypothetical protein
VLFVAVLFTVYVPFPADVGEVTFRVVVAEAPGEIERETAVNVPVQPEGALEARLNTEAVQGLTSLLVTDRVKESVVPATTPVACEGTRLTAGAACVQLGGGGGGVPVRTTVTEAPVADTALTVMETPEVESV